MLVMIQVVSKILTAIYNGDLDALVDAEETRPTLDLTAPWRRATASKQASVARNRPFLIDSVLSHIFLPRCAPSGEFLGFITQNGL